MKALIRELYTTGFMELFCLNIHAVNEDKFCNSIQFLYNETSNKRNFYTMKPLMRGTPRYNETSDERNSYTRKPLKVRTEPKVDPTSIASGP